MFKRKSTKKKDLLLFLDIDGVLNTTTSYLTKYEVKESNVNALSILIDMFNQKGYVTKVILSSTWRLGYSKEYKQCSPQVQTLITKLASVGITIYDKTPIYKDKTRDIEIARYIKEYELAHDNFTYLVLDDDISIFNQDTWKNTNIYKVNKIIGLTKVDIKHIIKMFK